MALSAGPRFRPVSETRKKGRRRRGRREEEERGRGENRGKRGPVSFPGHCGLLEVQEEPLINYDHYYHHLGRGH